MLCEAEVLHHGLPGPGAAGWHRGVGRLWGLGRRCAARGGMRSWSEESPEGCAGNRRVLLYGIVFQICRRKRSEEPCCSPRSS